MLADGYADWSGSIILSRMSRSIQHFAVVSCSIAALTFGGAVASAGVVYQGSDYSDSSDLDRKARICDGEDDGRNAYVNYVNGDSSTLWRLNDENGAISSCYSNTNRQPGGIQKHRTCEPINAWPDACSAYHTE